MLTINYINKRIDDEYCDATVNELKDCNLLNNYKKCKSVKNKIIKISNILKKYDINKTKIDNIISDYLIELIPAGTKGIIRGNKFNNIVKNTINNLKLSNNKFEICFEEQCKLYLTTEIPDWYILEKTTNKIIIGFNQLDLWTGGQQLNRGSKYLIDNKMNTNKSKLLCVICNKIKFNSCKNKTYKLFETGYTNNTLCYVNGMKIIIYDFFNLE